MRLPRLLAIFFLAAISILTMSAKCIENDTLSKDPSTGDWAIYGEIHNETDIQGVEMFLRGTLLDGNGNPLAESGSKTCPRELSPESLSVFKLSFGSSSDLPEPAGHQITVAGGKALEQPLPELNLISSATAALNTLDRFRLAVTYRSTEPYSARLSLCLAMYDTSGDVVQVIPVEGLYEPPKVNADTTLTLILAGSDVPAEATRIRYWLWLENPLDTTTSDHQAFVSELIPLNRPFQFEPAAAP